MPKPACCALLLLLLFGGQGGGPFVGIWCQESGHPILLSGQMLARRKPELIVHLLLLFFCCQIGVSCHLLSLSCQPCGAKLPLHLLMLCRVYRHVELTSCKSA